jgi:ribosomal protein S18 acetylase RimI-like enzyme
MPRAIVDPMNVRLERETSVPGVTLRPAAGADHDFLRRVYASTREEEMALVPWRRDEIDSFLDMQFEAQHAYYQKQFQDAEFLIIVHNAKPIGRLYLDRREDEIRIIDIALLTGERRNGVGGALLREVLTEARTAGKAVRIHVERNNPALRLYHRLGFNEIEDQGVYYLMEWRPESEINGAPQPGIPAGFVGINLENLCNDFRPGPLF